MRWFLILALASTAVATTDERRERRSERRRESPPAPPAPSHRVLEMETAVEWPMASAVGFWGGTRIGDPGYAGAPAPDPHVIRERILARVREGLHELDPEEDAELAKDFNRVRRSVRNLRDSELRPLLIRIAERAARRASHDEELAAEHESGGLGPAVRVVGPPWPVGPRPPAAPLPPRPLAAELEDLWGNDEAFRAFRKDFEKALRKGNNSWSAFGDALGAATEARLSRAREERIQAMAEKELELSGQRVEVDSRSDKKSRRRRDDGPGFLITAGALAGAYAFLRGVAHRG